MKLFGKKPAPRTSSRPVSRESEPSAPANVSRKNSCYEYLDGVMSNPDRRNSGTALKIYIENFKRLNEVFGYDYCEELLQQILTYLRQVTGKKLHQFIGVEYIVILEHTDKLLSAQICSRK